MTEPKQPHYDVIDGLRAVAVLSVVLYHLDRRLLPGGFIGVDVFFTISGFVVSLSMAKFRATSFSAFMGEFYARRLLRIAPALIVCLLVSSVVACLFIPQAWLSHANKPTALSAFVGFSNVVLARGWNDYFAPLAEFNPFTHTWSLGVEEQFYLAFPFLFYFLHRGRLAGRTGLILLAAAAAVSLGICAWWTQKYPPFAFYLLPPRFWELAVGILVFEATARSRWAGPSVPGSKPIAMAVLLLAIVASAALAGDGPFPFPWAIAPVGLTALLIWVTVSWRSGPVASPLAWPPVVWIGRVSYSFYLWHWPVVVMFRWTVGLETWPQKLAAFALSMALAAASYYWIELPCRDLRHRLRFRRTAVITASLATVVVAMAATELIYRNESSISLSVTAKSALWSPDGEPPGEAAPRCRVAEQSVPIEEGSIRTLVPTGCPRGPGRLFVIGDSHAGAYGGLFMRQAEQSGSEVHVAWQAGCGMFNLIRPIAENAKSCRRFAAEVLARFEAMAGPGDVLFLPALRIDRFQDQWGDRGLPDNHVPADRKAASTEAVRQLARFAAKGVSIVFEAPKPVFKSPPFRCSDWFNAANPICAGGFSISEAEFEARRAEALHEIRQVVAQLDRASIWDPARILCAKGVCSAFRNDQPLYFDGDHLSGWGNAALHPDFAVTVAARSTPPR